MLEINSDLISRIVKKVLAVMEKESKKLKITTIFTGGKLGFKDSVSELKKIDSQYNVDWNFIFSDSAKEILDHNKLRLDFAQKINRKKPVTADLKTNDLLLIAVLTRNTASKIAANFIDSKLLDYISRSLMLSVPTIAASDAADLSGDGWSSLGYKNIPQAMLTDNKNDLAKLESYGVNLVKAKNLSKTTFSILQEKNDFKYSDNNSENNVEKEKDSSVQQTQKMIAGVENEQVIKLEKKVITYRDINPLPAAISKIYLREDAIITPYAKEVAANKGMVICSQQK